MQFAGFSPGTRYTPVPDPLLGPLLEEIHDLAELLNDRVLLRGLSVPGGDPREEIRRGLRLAVARKTLLRYQPSPHGKGQPAPESPDQELYLLNTDSDRRALGRLEQGQASPGSRSLTPGQKNGGEIPPSPLSQRGVKGGFHPRGPGYPPGQPISGARCCPATA